MINVLCMIHIVYKQERNIQMLDQMFRRMGPTGVDRELRCNINVNIYGVAYTV